MTRKRHSGVTEQRKAGIHRLEDAQALFRASRWRGAMYLGGYAVECRIKYRLMQQWNCWTLEELEGKLRSKGVHENIFTHNLQNLLHLSGAAGRLRQNKRLWTLFGEEVNYWRPAWRYDPGLGTRDDAEAFLKAVSEVSDWIENNL